MFINSSGANRCVFHRKVLGSIYTGLLVLAMQKCVGNDRQFGHKLAR